eukprot:m.24669 g.24669  ORF g.24669 m.24669 type:complete len:441 (-) comp5685_c0_seq1:1140-2462(-)
MCGRTACTLSKDKIGKCCHDLKTPSSSSSSLSSSSSSSSSKSQKGDVKFVGREDRYRKSYNTTPKQTTPIIVMEHGELVVRFMQWGLVPSWHKKSARDFTMNMINARKETLAEIASYRNALQKGQRCVVIAEGYYEWEVKGKQRQPYYIYAPHDGSAALNFELDEEGKKENSSLMAFAALYDVHIDKNPQETKRKEIERRKKQSRRLHKTVSEMFKPKSEECDIRALKEEFDNEDDEDEMRMKDPTTNNDGVYDEYDDFLAKKEEEEEEKGSSHHVSSPQATDHQNNEYAEPLFTYSIITQPASPSLKWLHERMPAVLPTKDAIRDWLDTKRVPIEQALKRITPYDDLKFYPVSTCVGNIRNNGPECRKKIKLPSKTSSKLLNWIKQTQPAKKDKEVATIVEEEPTENKHKRPKLLAAEATNTTSSIQVEDDGDDVILIE